MMPPCMVEGVKHNFVVKNPISTIFHHIPPTWEKAPRTIYKHDQKEQHRFLPLIGYNGGSWMASAVTGPLGKNGAVGLRKVHIFRSVSELRCKHQKIRTLCPQ